MHTAISFSGFLCKIGVILSMLSPYSDADVESETDFGGVNLGILHVMIAFVQ